MKNSSVETVRLFYEAHWQGLFTYALSITRSRCAAEDVVHSVFCRLLRRRGLPRDMRPYVFRAVRNEALDLLRKLARPPLDESIYAPLNGDGGAELLARREEALRLLGRLTADERECIVLKIWKRPEPPTVHEYPLQARFKCRPDETIAFLRPTEAPDKTMLLLLTLHQVDPTGSRFFDVGV